MGVALKTENCNQSAVSFCANCSAPALVIIITNKYTHGCFKGFRSTLICKHYGNLFSEKQHDSEHVANLLHYYYTLAVTVNTRIQNLHLNEEFPVFTQNKPEMACLPWMTASVYNRCGYDAGWPIADWTAEGRWRWRGSWNQSNADEVPYWYSFHYRYGSWKGMLISILNGNAVLQ